MTLPPNLLSRIKQSPLLQGVSDGLADHVLDGSVCAGYRANQYLFKEGDSVDHLYFVDEGAVFAELNHEETGHSVFHPSFYCAPGDLLGSEHISPSEDEKVSRHSYAGKALQDSVVVKIPMERIKRAVLDQPYPDQMRLSKNVTMINERSISAYQNWRLSKGFNQSVSTLKHVLDNLVDKFGVECDEGTRLSGFTNTQIAQMADIVRERVSRIFKELHEKDVLFTSRSPGSIDFSKHPRKTIILAHEWQDLSISQSGDISYVCAEDRREHRKISELSLNKQEPQEEILPVASCN